MKILFFSDLKERNSAPEPTPILKLIVNVTAMSLILPRSGRAGSGRQGKRHEPPYILTGDVKVSALLTKLNLQSPWYAQKYVVSVQAGRSRKSTRDQDGGSYVLSGGWSLD